jgi:hypothetical protein
LQRALRAAWEEQRRFPLKLATVLSQKLANEGLQFFKVNKTVTHVSVARPHYLDLEATPVSEGVRRIVDFINATPKATRKKLLEALVPTAAPAVNGDKPAAPAEPTAEQTAVVGDLHWLVHQGHVIEFANGILETAKKPAPRPPKAEKPAAAAPKPAEGATQPAAESSAAEATAAPVEIPAESVSVAATETSEPDAPEKTDPVPASVVEPSV